jgi:small-conductance mechanosensitive channel
VTSIVSGFVLVGLALLATLQLLGVGPGLHDLIRTGLGIPAYLLFAGVVWWHRRTMAGAVAGPPPRSRWRSRIARFWPAIVIGFLATTYLITQTALTLGATLPGAAVLFTVLAFLATPHLDAMVGHWAQRGLESRRISILAAARRQTARFAILVIIVAMLGMLWATPLAAGFGFDMRTVGRSASIVALIALVGAFLWNLTATITTRALRPEALSVSTDEEMQAAPRSRLGTLVPLLSAVGKSSILALVLLSILVSLGVNVWPLITGLSVFGLAIAFGSQTLVKDVVSGLFFLIDDAFRFGEYIETSSAKGTVEKISIRSVSLRHHRGALATVPYGQIGEIQNFSRDWVVEKLTFRLALDTDVEKVRKLFKKIGQDIAADPELAGDLLEPFKSQGIAEVDDGTLLIRAKFKARPGKQYMIRRAALTAAHNAFRENGIKAVSKPMTANLDAAPAA